MAIGWAVHQGPIRNAGGAELTGCCGIKHGRRRIPPTPAQDRCGRRAVRPPWLSTDRVRSGAPNMSGTPRFAPGLLPGVMRPPPPEAARGTKAPSAGALALKNHFSALLQREVRARLRRDEPAIIVCPPVAQPVPSGFCPGGLRRHFVLRGVAFPRRPLLL
jgi:hypothetical protein